MKTVFALFVVAFLGLSGYSWHLSQQPELECHDSSVTGYLDHFAGATGQSTPRAAAQHQMIARGDRVVGARGTEPGESAFTYRSYEGDRLLEIVEVNEAAAGTWLATKQTRC